VPGIVCHCELGEQSRRVTPALLVPRGHDAAAQLNMCVWLNCRRRAAYLAGLTTEKQRKWYRSVLEKDINVVNGIDVSLTSLR